MAAKKRYVDNNPKNKPSGSDLNQPNCPLTKIGKEIENKREANNPAVVPPITRTSAKITTVVNEPIITGKIIVKLYRDSPNPKIQNRVAVKICKNTWEFEEISRPLGYQLNSSFQRKYFSNPFSTKYAVAL